MFFFQLPFLPEVILRAKDYGFIADVLDASKKYTGRDCFPESVKEAYKYSLGQPGNELLSFQVYWKIHPLSILKLYTCILMKLLKHGSTGL